jgi:nucleoside recognition membrane protein YjiH
MAAKSYTEGYTEEQLTKIKELESQKIGWGGYAALVFAVVFFSGFMTSIDVGVEWLNNILRIFDYSNLMGKFGLDLRGKGGNGARDGFLYVMTIWPNVTVALAFMNVIEGKRGLLAAQKLMNPVLRPLLGIPGWTGLALITGFMSSTDGGAALTRNLVDDELITEKELGIFSCFQFICSCGIGAPLSLTGVYLIYLTEVGIPLIYMFGLMIIAKIFAANLMRLYIRDLDSGVNKAKGEKA